MNVASVSATTTTANNTRTMTLTETATTQDEVYPMTLHPQQRVTWDENVIDNEGLGRKSSKRCCIFHKQRNFGESSSDESSSDDESSDNNCCSDDDECNYEGNMNHVNIKRLKKIARKKKIPDYQRYHA